MDAVVVWCSIFLLSWRSYMSKILRPDNFADKLVVFLFVKMCFVDSGEWRQSQNHSTMLSLGHTSLRMTTICATLPTAILTLTHSSRYGKIASRCCKHMYILYINDSTFLWTVCHSLYLPLCLRVDCVAGFPFDSLLPSFFLVHHTYTSLLSLLLPPSLPLFLLFSPSFSAIPTAHSVRSCQVSVLQTACLVLHSGWKSCSSSHRNLPFQLPGRSQGVPGKPSIFATSQVVPVFYLPLFFSLT